ncbi:MAG: hypothetical protein ABIF06_01660 [bacterium]
MYTVSVKGKFVRGVLVTFLLAIISLASFLALFFNNGVILVIDTVIVALLSGAGAGYLFFEWIPRKWRKYRAAHWKKYIRDEVWRIDFS